MLELDRPKPIQHSLLIDWIVNAYYSQAVPATSLSPGSPLLCPLNNRNKKKETATYLTSKETSTELLTGLSPQSLIIGAGYDPWVSADAVTSDGVVVGASRDGA